MSLLSLACLIIIVLSAAQVDAFASSSSSSAVSFLTTTKNHQQQDHEQQEFGVAKTRQATRLSVSLHTGSFGKLGNFADDDEDEDYNDNEEEEEETSLADFEQEHCIIAFQDPSTGSPDAPWSLPNTFEHFLNQCAIQSFLFLLKSMRDPQTVLWIEAFTKPTIHLEARPVDALAVGGSGNSKLLLYHGLAAMNTTRFPTWESYFSQLLQEPELLYVVESANPVVPEYDLEIKPASLCSRMVSVREQIAREFVGKDLDVIARMGGKLLASYWENLKNGKVDTDGNGNRVVRLQRENLLFLDEPCSPDSDFAPSPLRKGNFDLLVLLSTQEAIHRVLNDPTRRRTTDADKVANHFLHNFYVARVKSHFGGAQRYGRADDFLQELLETAPSLITLNDDLTLMVDPHFVAKELLKERELVAQEWKELARNAPQEHMEIKRLQLNLLMGISNSPEPVSSESANEDVEFEEADGAFE